MCAGQTQSFDFQAAEAFAGTVSDMLNAAATVAMISVGHRLGLLEALAGASPASSAELAARTDLSERYVREWLAVMTVSKLVSYAPQTSTYCLPSEHAACLTAEAPLGNLAVYAQFVVMAGKMEDRLLRCFRTGEGTEYGDYPCFHQIMAEDSGQTVSAALFSHVLPLVEGLQERLEAGIDVLDAGCGRGDALFRLAEAFPNSRFLGLDLCADAVEYATERAWSAGLSNLRYEQRDLTGYVEVGRWDLITSFDAVHDQKDPAGLLNGLRRSLKADGVYLMQDIGGSARLENNLEYPMAALLYTASLTHCTPVSIGQGGPGLGTMWGWETAERMLREAGFGRVRMQRFQHDPLNVWFVASA